MSNQHDFSDPATYKDDEDYWRTAFQTDPFLAERERVTLILTRFNEQTAALIAKAQPQHRDLVATSRTKLMNDLMGRLTNNLGSPVPESPDAPTHDAHLKELYRIMGELFRNRPQGETL